MRELSAELTEGETIDRMAGILAYTFFSPSGKNSVFATSLIRGRQWFLRNNLSVSAARCHLSFQERQDNNQKRSVSSPIRSVNCLTF